MTLVVHGSIHAWLPFAYMTCTSALLTRLAYTPGLHALLTRVVPLRSTAREHCRRPLRTSGKTPMPSCRASTLSTRAEQATGPGTHKRHIPLPALLLGEDGHFNSLQLYCFTALPTSTSLRPLQHDRYNIHAQVHVCTACQVLVGAEAATLLDWCLGVTAGHNHLPQSLDY